MAATKAPSFPAESTPARERKPDYFLAYAKAFYWDFTNRGPKIFWNQREVYERNRLYSQGMQNPAKYKKLLDSEDTNPTYTQLDFTIVPVWPKFRDIIIAKMANRASDVVATPIDALSQEQEKQWVAEQHATIQNQDVAQGLGALGVDVGQGPTLPEGVTQAVPMEQPQTPEEVELFRQMAYKSRRAMAIEIGVDVVQYDNDHREIRRQLREDILDCGVAVEKDYVDPVTGKIRLRRCDPAMMLSSYSARSDFRYATRMGELVAMTVAEVLDAGKGQLDEEAVRQVKARAGGQSRTGYDGMDYPPGMVDAGSVLVLDCEWFGKDSLSVLRRGGVMGLLPDDYAPQEGDEVKTTDFETVYRCKWVVGTQVVFDFGIAPNQKRDRTNLGQGHLSFSAYGVNLQNMRNLPFTSRVVPLVDDYQLTRIKLQHLVATAKPKGIMVEYGSLNGVLREGEDEFAPLELMRIYDQTGNVLYNRIDINGDPLNGRPVQELENGLARDTLNLIQISNFHLDQLRMVTGLNEAADASAPAPGQLNGTTQASLQATNLALQPLFDADDVLLELCARSIIARLQADWSRYQGSHYVQSMGQMVLQTLSEDPGMSVAEFGIKIEAAPSAAEEQAVENYVQASLNQRATTGKGGIEMEDAMIVRRLSRTNPKQAEQYLILRRKKRRDEDMQQAQQQVEMNTQQQQASAEATAQAALQQAQMQSDLRLKEFKEMEAIKEQSKQADHERAIQLKNLEGQIKGQLIDLKGDIDLEMTDKKIEEYDAKTDHRTENIADGPDKRPTL